VRRLAKQKRNDAYASLRDYQTLHKARGLRFTITSRPSGSSELVLVGSDVTALDPQGLVAFGGFVRPLRPTELELTLEAGGVQATKSILLPRAWSRIGIVVEGASSSDLRVTMRWRSRAGIDAWGLAGGAVVLPEGIPALDAGALELGKRHLAPETFFFPHEGAVTLDVDETASSPFKTEDGASITLKKCSYCGRLLPLDPQRPGMLSFHKHNAKRTGHQNECRACKKWRINDSFNPLRTVDQLNESSLITRERKMFLREPEILARLKERTGAGLKSQIWERFGRRCFNCRTKLALNEVDLDHTRPLAYLWPIDEHATCLCSECNNHKKEKFPVDFYSDEQLASLSKICGLSVTILKKKELNARELQRILDDLPTFAQQWDARHFAASARKIAELRPDVDLFELLKETSPKDYDDLMERYRQRPPAVGEFDE
jgi:hypothetical protein